MPKNFIEKFNILEKQQESIAKEFEKLYTDIYGYFVEDERFEGINEVYNINISNNGICIYTEVEYADFYEPDIVQEQDIYIDLPLDFFSNYNEYLADKNKKEQENLENKRLKDIKQLKREISDKAEKLYSLTENVCCGDIQTLLEDI